MKRIITAIFASVLLLSYAAADAQIRKIPAEVTDAFKEKYPEANGVEWKDKLTVFQANFQLNGTKHEARFNSSGEWQETVKTLDQDKLPEAVKEGFSKSKFTDWEVRETSFLEKKEGDGQYRMLVRKNDIEKRYLFFDKSGKLVRDAITL